MTCKNDANISLETFAGKVASAMFRGNFSKIRKDNDTKHYDITDGECYMFSTHDIAVSDASWCKSYYEKYVRISDSDLLVANPMIAFYDIDGRVFACYIYNESTIDENIHDVIEAFGIKNAWTCSKISPVAFEMKNGFWIIVAPRFCVDDSVDVEKMPLSEIKKKIQKPVMIVDVAKYAAIERNTPDGKNKHEIILDALTMTRKTMF